jgi:3-oxoacyl-[acyl-carrier-protein] synthase III
MRYSTIKGTGGYLPPKVLTNFDLEKMVDTTNEWIVERTGIHQRHVGDENETSLSMSEHAARKAMEVAGIEPADLDMIIVATTTPHKVFPSTACLLQERFDVGGCPAFDLNSTACAGFMYAFSIADQYIRQGAIKHALVIGAELASRVVDWKDRTTCVLFGDGAGAVILGESKEPGVISTHLHANGMYKDILYLDALIGQERTYMKMQGNQLFKVAVNVLGELFDETLAANGIQKSDINWLVPHQANLRIIHAMAKKLDLSMEQVIVTLDKQANTSSASIPLALDEGIRDGRIKRGDMLLLEGIGGGLAWGSALVKY